MKKILAVLVLSIAICTTVFAQERNSEYKKSFYDSLQYGMINSIKDSLEAQGIPAAKAEKYTTGLSRRIDRKVLENSTWACVSKYSDEELISKKEKIADECFSNWVTDLVNNNADLLELLK